MTAGRPTPAKDDDTSPAALWDAARYALDWLVNLFGAPEELAGWGVLAPRERTELLGWLRPLEALVRTLLMIAAAALPAPVTPAPSASVRVRRSREMVEHDPDAPDHWRVSFRTLPSPPGCSSGRRSAGETELPPAWPIAERLEAVIRVLNNPGPVAARLSRRLRARPDRVVRVLGRPPSDEPGRPGVWAHRQAHQHALGLVAAFDTS